MKRSPSGINKKAHRRWHLLLHILVIIAAVLAAWLYIDFASLIETLFNPHPSLLVLLLVVVTIDRFLMAWKWRHLLITAGQHVPYLPILRAYYEAAFVARVTPVAVSGDILRAYTVSKYVGDWQLVLGSMVAEKAIAIVSSTFLAAVGAFIVIDQLSANGLLFIAPGLAVLTILVASFVALSMMPKFGAYLLQIVPHKKIKSLINKLHEAYAVYSNHAGQLLINWCMALLENSLQVLLLFLSARAIDLDVSTMQLIGILALSQLLRKVALILEGWMLGEAAVVVTCALLGIDQTQALAFSLLSGAAIIVSTLPGLITLLLPSSRSRRQLIKAKNSNNI